MSNDLLLLVMDSVFWMRVVAVSSILGTGITIFGTYKLGVATKNESDTASQKITAKMQQVGEQANTEIQQVKSRIVERLERHQDSIVQSIDEKSAETLAAYDRLHRQLIAAGTRLDRQFAGLKNPLSPFKVTIAFNVDISEIPEEMNALLEQYRNYLHSLGSYPTAIYEFMGKKQLPEGLMLFPGEKNPQEIGRIRVRNFDLKEMADGPPPYAGQFQLHHVRVLTTYLPKITLFFLASRKLWASPEFAGDLVYEIGDYYRPSAPTGQMSYSIDFEKKVISFEMEVVNPAVSRSTGNVTSLKDCSEGYIGVRFRGFTEKKISIGQTRLYYGPNYASYQALPLRKVSLEIYKGLWEDYFLMDGKGVQ